MAVITELPLVVGASAHISCNVLDQFGNVIPGLQAVIVDPGPATTFTPDVGETDEGTVTGVNAGTDTLTATYLGLTAPPLPVTVTAPAPVPTSLQWTSP